ncbi:MAG: hypothetical protein JJU11_02500 [Candidatus Sumerlaeia bacterium]|nr:hypothetical protein [Candidatus Sumerlaeia bacterium]
MPTRHIASILAIALLSLYMVGCATIRRDQCFIHQYRYDAMKSLFLQTGSYQRVAQAMADEGGARCEVNSFRQMLRKDLGLEGEEYRALFRDLEPGDGELDYHPGYVGDVD